MKLQGKINNKGMLKGLIGSSNDQIREEHAGKWIQTSEKNFQVEYIFGLHNLKGIKHINVPASNHLSSLMYDNDGQHFMSKMNHADYHLQRTRFARGSLKRENSASSLNDSLLELAH